MRREKMKRKTKKPENVPKLKLQTGPCMLCRLCQGEHSEELWKMHKGTVEMAQSKTQHKKLWTMQIGFGPRCAALLDNGYESETVIQRHGFLETVVPSGLNPAEHLHPIYMSCTGCGLSLGKTEEGSKPANRAKSQPASVCPARIRTPPCWAINGKTCPG